MTGNVRFEELQAGDEAALARMSALASAIVKEYYDPLIGPEANDYMIGRFQSAEGIAAQMAGGSRYFFVVDGEGDEAGFVAFADKGDCLYLSKFYLRADQRGRGFARPMLAFVEDAARKAGRSVIRLDVYRGNDARLFYETMGFVRTGVDVHDIGGGFSTDGYFYELSLR